ncbi:DUF551 domain-containing protein [Comamonas sediminis]|uniref:DUF551 domain-containing protein n=1 Tax=Comamonas sediminis TaxID=1783360 RepID=A0ABV4B972_9BURK
MTTPDPSREAFGKHVLTENGIFVRGQGWLNRDELGAYKHPEIQARWLTWQAAMAHKGADCWQSIETAPKDGTEVWAFNGEQARMRWIEGPGYALWVWVDALLEDADPSPDQPTHWQPLPAAPKQEEIT